MTARSRLAARAFRLPEKRSKTQPEPTRTPRFAARLPRAAALTGCLAVLVCISCGQRASHDLPTTLESGGTPIEHAAPVVEARVERVVDGDTVVVVVADKQETVRLLGIDTPEKVGGPRPAECFGSQASAYASELLPVGTVVQLSRDHETRDQYGRLLAYMHRADDGLFINLQMVATGHASPLFFSPNTSARDEFTTAADHARRAWIGFWATCGGADLVLPPEEG